MNPDYQAKIYIPNNLHLEIYFARPLDADIRHEIEQFFYQYEGFSLQAMENLPGKPLWVDVNPLYDTITVAHEIEKILRSHGFINLVFKIDEIGHSRTVTTLSES